MIECPHCLLANADGAQRCDCGWDFTSSHMRSCFCWQTIGRSNRGLLGGRSCIEIVVLPVALLVWLLRHSPWLVLVIVLAASLVALLGSDSPSSSAVPDFYAHSRLRAPVVSVLNSLP